MASIFTKRKSTKLYARVKNEHGRWIDDPTPYRIGDEQKAREYATKLQVALDKRRAELVGTVVVPLVRDYAVKWLDEREALGVASIAMDRSRMKRHVLPTIGGLRLDEVKPKTIRELVRGMRRAGELSPRTILNVYGMVHTMFRDAVVDEHIAATPCVLESGELPTKVDKDPEWRTLATYTRAEVEALLGDARIPTDRRMLYALKALAGLRHGEAAGLCWRHYTPAPDLQPLGRLLVARSYARAGTKTEVTRAMPVVPLLAAFLTRWRGLWSSFYGREPGPGDYIVPTLAMTPRAPQEAQDYFVADLATLGLRTAAGEHRDRGGHDLRAWMITSCQEAGAHRDLLAICTHTKRSDVLSGYTRATWAALCAEVGKLQVSVEDPLAPCCTLAAPSLSAIKRWRREVTPLGLERNSSSSRVVSNGVTLEDREGRHDPRPREPMGGAASLAAPSQPALLPGETGGMPSKPTYPVRLIFDLDPDEHAAWCADARAEGLDLDAWVLKSMRAMRRARSSDDEEEEG